MTLARLAWKNIAGSPFRSGAILLASVLVASLALVTTVIVRGAQESLRHNLSRLGADLLVVPWGTITEEVEGAQMMSVPTRRWMGASKLDEIAAVEGVVLASPQVYLGSVAGHPLLPNGELLVVGFDPAADFTVLPWLPAGAARSLSLGEAFAGSKLDLTAGESLEVFGYPIRVAEKLLSNGTDMDRTLFVSLETSADMIASVGHPTIRVVPGGISTVLVRIDLSETPSDVAFKIYEQVPSVVPVKTSDFIQSERIHMVMLLRSIVWLLAGVWVLSVVFVGLVFSIAVHERRREIAMLRALGSPWVKIFWMILGEGLLLSVAGGIFGVLLGGTAMTLFRDAVLHYLEVPFTLPSPSSLVLLALVGLLLAFVSVFFGAAVPAYRITREEVALMMRE